MVLKADQVQALMESFERHKLTHKGQEVWSARDLMVLFGYKSWTAFRNTLFRAMNAMEVSGIDPEIHFVQVNEIHSTDGRGRRARENFYTTRAGAYMLAQETDSKEYEAASFARTYFSARTRQAELFEIQAQIEAEEKDLERLDAREKLRSEEKGFQDVLWEAGVRDGGIARIREEGNKVFFGGFSTEDMRWRLGIGGTKRSPSDFLPTPIVLAKALIASLTQQRVVEENQKGELRIGSTHVEHSKHVRKALLDSGVCPEKTQPEEDILLVRKRVSSKKRVSMRVEPIPAISLGEVKIIGIKDSVQSGAHPPLFDLED